MTMGPVADPDVAWVLWVHDTFDREASPSREREGRGLFAGLSLLWSKHFSEGVGEDGRATFSCFSLVLPGTNASIDRFYDRATLAKLGGWIKVPDASPGVLHGIVVTHAGLLANAEPQPETRILDAAKASEDPRELLKRLADLLGVLSRAP